MADNARKNPEQIKISIIIPTYNRAQRLQNCLEALFHQSQPPQDFEVIVVVDGSTDKTREMLDSLQTPYSLRVIYQENSGQNLARNRGAATAQGRYCLFIDDDIIAEPELVAVHLQALQKRSHIVGLGQITLKIPDHADQFTCYYSERWSAHYTALDTGKITPGWLDCYGGNLSIAREAFLSSGGFAPDLRRSHDIELGYRLAQQGLTFVYLPEAVGHQDEQKGMRQLMRDAENSGMAWITLCQRHPAMLPDLLGSFIDASPREVLAHRLLLALHFPIPLLTIVGKFFQNHRQACRWYRFMHNHGYWRGMYQAVNDTETWRRLTQGTSILMYHAFGTKDESASRFVISAQRFARQMAWLKWRKYKVLSLAELVSYLQEYRLPPSRSVVITLDDGYSDTLIAEPILRRYGFPATLFLVNEKAGKYNCWSHNSELQGRPLMTWSEIKSITSKELEIGAHTHTHPSLPDLSIEQQRDEIIGAKKELEERLDRPIRFLAYPYGEYDTETQAIAVEAGYLACCSVDPGPTTVATPLYALRRIEIDGTDSLLKFMLKFW